MIFSFDGNVFAGKTSLVNSAAEISGGQPIGEYGIFLKRVAASRCKNKHLAKQIEYLRAESIRQMLIRPGKTIFLDRSFVSLAAHVFALYKRKSADIRKSFLNRLKAHIKAGEVSIPDVYFFVDIPYPVAKGRFAKGAKNKKTAALYIERDYFGYIEEFNRRWAKLARGIILDGTDFQSSLTIIKKASQNKHLSAIKDSRVIDLLSRIYF